MSDFFYGYAMGDSLAADIKYQLIEARAEVERLEEQIRQHVDYCPSLPDEWRTRYVDGETDD
jgi:hypothetical protein